MKKLFLFAALTLGGLIALEDTSSAHGGTYRGPGDTVPPGGGGGATREPERRESARVCG